MDHSRPAPPSAGLPSAPRPRVASRAAIPVIAGASALWAVAGVVASRLFDAGMRPLDLAGIRALVTAIGLAALPASWRRARGEAPAGPVVMLGVALALVTTCYYLAIERLPVAIGIVLQYTGPVLVFAWTAVVFRRRPAPAVVGALAGATAGVVLVTGIPGGDLGGLDGVGIVMGLGAAIAFAAYTVLSEVVRRSLEPQAAAFRAFTVTAALWVVVVVAGGRLPAWEAEWAGAVLFVAIAGTLVPFVAFVWAVALVRAERAAIAATLEPVLAAAVAWAWIGQALSVLQIVGGALVIASVAALQLFGSRPS